MKVFMVSEGSYTDYTVRGVYSTAELAQEAVKRYAGNPVEEFDLDAMPELRDGQYAWRVDFSSDGKVTRIETTSLEINYQRPSGFVRADKTACIHCFARDEAHAVKTASEVRVIMLVNNLLSWPVK